MTDISHLKQSSINSHEHFHKQRTEVNEQRSHALRAVREENKLAAIDKTELSSSFSYSSKFEFEYSSSVQINWQNGNMNGQSQVSFQSNFSFGFKVNQSMQVELNEGIQISEEQMSGEDFRLDKDGILKLFEELIEKLSNKEQDEIDLGGELGEQVLSLLEELGLLDEEGKATPMLQAMSDYAGLNRFQAGQSVRIRSEYSYSAKMTNHQMGMLAWQQANQGSTEAVGSGDTTNAATSVNSGIGGANTVSGSNIGGDVSIDDRDVININIHNK